MENIASIVIQKTNGIGKTKNTHFQEAMAENHWVGIGYFTIYGPTFLYSSGHTTAKKRTIMKQIMMAMLDKIYSKFEKMKMPGVSSEKQQGILQCTNWKADCPYIVEFADEGSQVYDIKKGFCQHVSVFGKLWEAVEFAAMK